MYMYVKLIKMQYIMLDILFIRLYS